MIIKYILKAVMPIQLYFDPFTAFLVVSTVFGISEAKKKEKRVIEAQEKQQRIEKGIQQEQASRERRKQVRLATAQRAQADAGAFAESGSVGANTGVNDAIGSNLARNFSSINFALQSSNAVSAAQQNVANAGRTSTAALINQGIQPLVANNLDNLNQYFDNAFSSKSGTTTIE